MRAHHQLDAGRVGHGTQPEALGEPYVGGEVRDRGDQQGLRGFRFETGRGEQLAERGGGVVGVPLPLELADTQRREVLDLRRDLGLSAGGGEAGSGPDDPVPVVGAAGLPYDRARPLDTHAGAIGAGVFAHLTVEEGQGLLKSHPRIGPRAPRSCHRVSAVRASTRPRGAHGK